MKKKISLLLCLLLAASLFAGCAKEEAAMEYDEETIGQTIEFMIDYCESASEEDIANWNSLSAFVQESQIAQVGLMVTPESLSSFVETWYAGIDECGAYEGHGDFVYEATADGVTVTAPFTYADRDADVVFEFDGKSYLESMTVNAKYSTAEILKKAGLNTVLGMGTVFAVLIFISIIISLFGFIPKIEAALKKKPEESAEAPAAAAASAPAAAAAAPAETDDLELIAVISAAIAAAEGQTGTDGFVVRSIRRRPSNKWNA